MPPRKKVAAIPSNAAATAAVNANDDSPYESGRNFSAIARQKLLGEDVGEITKYLAAHPKANILEIGCGEGHALRELKGMFPNASFYGLDLTKPIDVSGFTFIAGSIDNSALGAEYKQRFDIIFSAATFPYVKDKATAFVNCAAMLKDNGRGYIGIEPFYFGPQGLEMFGNSRTFKWNKDSKGIFRTVVVKTDEKAAEDPFPGFVRYDIPPCLLIDIYRLQSDKGGPNINVRTIPSGCSEAEIRKFIAEHKCDHQSHEKGRINWDMLSFLKVHTYNPKGVGSANTPFLRAAPIIYLRRGALADPNDEKKLAQYLIEPRHWNVYMRERNWWASGKFIAICGRFDLTRPEPYFGVVTDFFASKKSIYLIRAVFVLVAIALLIRAGGFDFLLALFRPRENPEAADKISILPDHPQFKP